MFLPLYEQFKKIHQNFLALKNGVKQPSDAT